MAITVKYSAKMQEFEISETLDFLRNENVIYTFKINDCDTSSRYVNDIMIITPNLPRPITSQARELAREIGPGAQNSLGAPGI
jgi:hypothetical protein